MLPETERAAPELDGTTTALRGPLVPPPPVHADKTVAPTATVANQARFMRLSDRPWDGPVHTGS
jgi:hypothetical protein